MRDKDEKRSDNYNDDRDGSGKEQDDCLLAVIQRPKTI